MTLEEAIVTALEHENRVRDHYAEAARGTRTPKSKKFFEVLAHEEQGHVEYLQAKLLEWRSEGIIREEVLVSAVPSAEWISRGVGAAMGRAKGAASEDDAQRLHTALRLEEEVSEYYRGLVGTIGPDGEPMFRRFLEIEDGHTAIVRAEIDVLQQTGYFFDFQEFTQEG